MMAQIVLLTEVIKPVSSPAFFAPEKYTPPEKRVGCYPHPRLLPAWPGNFSVTRRADSPEGWARQAAGGPGRGFLHFQRGSERLTVLRSGCSAPHTLTPGDYDFVL